MADTEAMPVSAAVEGTLDEAVLRRIGESAGIRIGVVYGRNGKQPLLQRLHGYNQAAQHSPWVVLVDLDRDADCAPAFQSRWLPAPAVLMCFRVAVREIEAWLLADSERVAAFLGVARHRVPNSPESLPDPKQTLVSLAAQSRRRAVREEIVPRAGSGRAVGAAYTSRMADFVRTEWRPEVAAQRSDSLDRCLRRLKQLAAAQRAGVSEAT